MKNKFCSYVYVPFKENGGKWVELEYRHSLAIFRRNLCRQPLICLSKFRWVISAIADTIQSRMKQWSCLVIPSQLPKCFYKYRLEKENPKSLRREFLIMMNVHLETSFRDSFDKQLEAWSNKFVSLQEDLRSQTHKSHYLSAMIKHYIIHRSFNGRLTEVIWDNRLRRAQRPIHQGVNHLMHKEYHWF